VLSKKDKITEKSVEWANETREVITYNAREASYPREVGMYLSLLYTDIAEVSLSIELASLNK
jgi:hypothetical protein